MTYLYHIYLWKYVLPMKSAPISCRQRCSAQNWYRNPLLMAGRKLWSVHAFCLQLVTLDLRMTSYCWVMWCLESNNLGLGVSRVTSPWIDGRQTFQKISAYILNVKLSAAYYNSPLRFELSPVTSNMGRNYPVLARLDIHVLNCLVWFIASGYIRGFLGNWTIS